MSICTRKLRSLWGLPCLESHRDQVESPPERGWRRGRDITPTLRGPRLLYMLGLFVFSHNLYKFCSNVMFIVVTKFTIMFFLMIKLYIFY
jgi:hypothetical protein